MLPLVPPVRYGMRHRLPYISKSCRRLAACLFAAVVMSACGGDSPDASSPGTPSSGLDSSTTPSTTEAMPSVASTPAMSVSDDTRQVAQSLDNDARKIFQYVANNFEFEPYYVGALKGTQETLLQRAGNDYDLATVLIALFDSAGVEARYVQGMVTVPITQAMSWLGVESPATAEKLLQTAEQTSGNTTFKSRLVNNGGALELLHIWVEAKLDGREWTALDPSFKLHVLKPGRNIAQEAGLSGRQAMDDILDGKVPDFAGLDNGSQPVENPLSTGSSPEVPAIVLPDTASMVNYMEGRRQRMLTYLQLHEPALTTREIIGGKQIVVGNEAALPTDLPFAVQGEVKRFTVVPDTDKHYVQVFFQGINTALALPETAGKNVTITFAGVSADDQAKLDAAGSLVGIPANSIHLKPQLKVDGVVRAEGFGLGAGTSLANFLQLTFRKGFLVQQTVTHQNLTVGGQYAIVLDTQTVSKERMRRSAQRLRTLALSASPSEALAPELLNLLGLTFFSYQDRFAEYAAGIQNVLAVQGVNEALVGLDVAVGPNQQLSLGRMRIDNQRNAFEFVPRKGEAGFDPQPMRFALIAASSGLEEAIFRAAAGLPAVSTARVFANAADTGTAIVAVKQGNASTLLPMVEASPLVRGAISVAINEGRTVLIPQNLTHLMDWSGTGWADYPLGTATGGFNVSGNTGGGEVIWKLFTGTRPQQEQAFKDIAVFAVGFVDGYLLGDGGGNYEQPAAQVGQFYGELISGLFLYGDVLTMSYAIDAVVMSHGQEGWKDVGYAALAFLPVLETLKYAKDFSEFGKLKKIAQEAGEDLPKAGPGGGLQAHEGGTKGHTLEKHIGKTKADLEKRLAEEPDLHIASSFYDRETAEAAVAQTLLDKKDKIAAFLKNDKKVTQNIDLIFPTPQGDMLFRGKTELVPGYKVVVGLKKNPSMPEGYHIVTAVVNP